MRRALGPLAALLAGTAAAVLVPQAAFASTAPSDGADVSRYQQNTDLPSPVDFGVVAVNDGLPTGTNPWLADQLAWAAQSSGAGHAKVDVYVASANPGLAGAWWPTGDATRAGVAVRSPYGGCTSGSTSTACAWVYGNSIARDDQQVRGVDAAGVAVGTWWIDVEADNTWSASTAANRAVVEGMIAGLRAGNRRVGIYALPTQFSDILGRVPASSAVAGLSSWVAGAKDESAARSRCSGTPMTATGRLVLVQWVDFSLQVDHDVACGVLTQPRPTVSGHLRVGAKLTAKLKTWSPSGVHLTYRWTRDGRPIAKAVHRTYRLQRADRHHRIGVTVTGTLTGYSRAVQRSTTHRIAS